MRKLTTEVFKERMFRQFGDSIEILGEYVTAKTQIEYKCTKCGKVCCAWPDSLYKQKWACRDCMNISKRKTHEEHLTELHSGIECVSNYVNAKTTVTYKCPNCEYTWDTLPYNVIFYGIRTTKTTAGCSI
jgi:DNA-directed RNA polymerase subunit RPC12/RpoP